MKIFCIDFESYYDPKDYTLTKMTTEEYIRDPRFEALCVSVVHGGKGTAIPQEHLKAFFEQYDMSDVGVICHHAQFDGLIMSHHFGVKPAFWFDTISMARIVYGPHQRLSLAALLLLHGMEPKTINYQEFAGKRWHQMGDRTRQMLLDGAVHDSVQTEKLFYMMLPHIPKIELQLIDRTIRTFTEPQAEGDLALIREVCRREVNEKEDMLCALNVTKKDLGNNEIFTKLLENEGIEVEYKESKTIDKKTGKPKQNPAFAKTDGFMQDLAEDDSPRVRALAEARLGIKSTINETRAGRMLRMAERGPLCIYLHHGKTHTLRPAGGDKMNWLNLPRGGDLRRAVKAPEGKLFSIKDYSTFELRLALWVSGQTDKLELVRNGADVYCDFGTGLYGRDITKADEVERYISKQVVLGSQYRQGSAKLHRELNFKHKVSTSLEFCERAVEVYRKEEYPCIGHPKTGVWRQLDDLIPHLANGDSFQWKCFRFQDGRCYAPNGCYMFFQNIEWREDAADYKGGSWWFEKRKGMWVRFHGGIFFENLIQFLQRCLAAEALTSIPRKHSMILFPYDEMVHAVPEDIAEEAHIEMIDIMCTPPTWAPDLPIKVEGTIADRYEK